MRNVLASVRFWPAILILGACGGSSTPTAGISKYLSGVTSSDGSLNGVLNSGTPPSGSGPSVTVNSSGAAIAGGAQFVELTCSTNCTSVLVAVQGVDGYYVVSGLPASTSQSVILNIAQTAAAERSAPPTVAESVVRPAKQAGDRSWHTVTESVARSPQQVGQAGSSFTAQIAAGAGSTFGTLIDFPIALTSVGAGDVEVSLNWDVDTDLDLHVVEPSGFEIYYGSLPSPSGGTLDLDSNPACALDHLRAEHVTWPTGTPPSGTYQVIVDSFALCSPYTSVNYVVTVNVKGRATQVFHGTFTTEDSGANCWVATGQAVACGTLVTSFTYP